MIGTKNRLEAPLFGGPPRARPVADVRLHRSSPAAEEYRQANPGGDLPQTERSRPLDLRVGD